jgi:hypothetical protein
VSTRNRTGGFTGIAVVLLGAVLACAADAAAQTETRFTIIDSSPSSWVARGYDNYTVTPADGWTFRTGRNFDNGVNIDVSGPALPGTTVGSWDMEFAAPGDALLVPGHYANFQRFPFQANDRPGLAFGSTGRLDNQAAGFFDILEATYGPGGQVLSFAANFTHYGETNPNNYAIVEVRYNAAVPEPAGAAVVSGGLALLLRRRRS